MNIVGYGFNKSKKVKKYYLIFSDGSSFSMFETYSIKKDEVTFSDSNFYKSLLKKAFGLGLKKIDLRKLIGFSFEFSDDMTGVKNVKWNPSFVVVNKVSLNLDYFKLYGTLSDFDEDVLYDVEVV